MKDYLLDAAVCLRRNYEDLPFDCLDNEETARRVNERAVVALERSGNTYAYLLPANMSAEKRELLQSRRLLTADAQESAYGAAYLRTDERVCVETGGEDHLAVMACDPDGDVMYCLKCCRRVVEQLKDTGRMAQSGQYGYLTARPSDAGTGLRASVTLHLPLTVMLKQLPAAMKVAAMNGMVLRGLGNGLCLLENRVTMGAEDEELLQRLLETARKLCELEAKLRARARERQEEAVLDKVWRAYAAARYARRITKTEAMQTWSALTLGLSLAEMPYDQKGLNDLWEIAHLPPEKLRGTEGKTPDSVRADRVRTRFDGGE